MELTENLLEPPISSRTPAEAAAEIARKIKELMSLQENKEILRQGMKDVQRSLLQNPAACSVMLPEDIGAAVQLIRVLSGKEIKEQETKKSSNAAAKKVQNMSPEDIARALQDEL